MFTQAAEYGVPGMDGDDRCSQAEQRIKRWLEGSDINNDEDKVNDDNKVSREDIIIFIARRMYLLFLPDGTIMTKVNPKAKM